MGACEGKKYCLVIADIFSKWTRHGPSALPTELNGSLVLTNGCMTNLVHEYGSTSHSSVDGVLSICTCNLTSMKALMYRWIGDRIGCRRDG